MLGPRLKETLTIVIPVVMTNMTMAAVLKHNVTLGIYAAEADSISIPLTSGLISSALLLLLMLPAVIIPRTRTSLVWIQTALLITGAVYAWLNGTGWLLPNHYLIALSYLFVILAGIWLAAVRLRKLLSDS